MDRIATERHLKQNKEIIRINQVQSNRIAALETEITKLLSENIQLRTQVIQLTHRQDLTNQKAQIERKVRELHRLVKNLGSVASSTSESPLQPIIKKSPKKANLLSISPEHSPERPAINYVSTRSKPRSLAAPGRVVHRPSEDSEVSTEEAGCIVQSTHDAVQTHEPQQPSADWPATSERRRESRDRDRERDVRRSSRRISITGEDIKKIAREDMADVAAATGSPARAHLSDQSLLSNINHSNRRRSRSSMNFEPIQLFPGAADVDENVAKRMSRRHDINEDKENGPLERRSTPTTRVMHSSPVKSRSALNLIADPLPSYNIQPLAPTPTKPLKEVQEVKSEPVSPSLDDQTRTVDAVEGTGGRSRRGKTVNYAEPSLRHKMRRTESLPGDKRRKSTYRRSSSSLLDDRRSSSSSRQAITIEED